MQNIFCARRSGSAVALGFAVGLLLALCGRAAQADATGQAQQAIQQVCNQSDASYARSDLAGYMRMYDPACRMTNVAGKDTGYHQLWVAATKALSYTHELETIHTVIRDVRLQGGTAYATTDTEYDSHYRDYTYSRKTVCAAVWVKEPTGWRVLRLQMMIDTLRYQRNSPPPLT